MDVDHGVSGRAISRALGEQLRRAREEVGWSQAELVARMPADIHVKTLATYEQGVRQCTVVRLVEICRTMGVVPSDLLAMALQHAETDLQTAGLHVDLQAMARDTHVAPSPLRRWARTRLANNPAVGVAKLDRGATQEMAAMAGLRVSELVHQLERFAPRSTRRPPQEPQDSETT